MNKKELRKCIDNLELIAKKIIELDLNAALTGHPSLAILSFPESEREISKDLFDKEDDFCIFELVNTFSLPVVATKIKDDEVINLASDQSGVMVNGDMVLEIDYPSEVLYDFFGEDLLLATQPEFYEEMEGIESPDDLEDWLSDNYPKFESVNIELLFGLIEGHVECEHNYGRYNIFARPGEYFPEASNEELH